MTMNQGKSRKRRRKDKTDESESEREREREREREPRVTSTFAGLSPPCFPTLGFSLTLPGQRETVTSYSTPARDDLRRHTRAVNKPGEEKEESRQRPERQRERWIDYKEKWTKKERGIDYSPPTIVGNRTYMIGRIVHVRYLYRI